MHNRSLKNMNNLKKITIGVFAISIVSIAVAFLFEKNHNTNYATVPENESYGKMIVSVPEAEQKRLSENFKLITESETNSIVMPSGFKGDGVLTYKSSTRRMYNFKLENNQSMYALIEETNNSATINILIGK